MASAWGESWGLSWGESWGQNRAVIPDSHDGGDNYRRRQREYKLSNDEFRAQIEAAFDSVISPQVAKIVAPYVEMVSEPPKLETLQGINWTAIYADMERISREIDAIREADDEEALWLLMQ